MVLPLNVILGGWWAILLKLMATNTIVDEALLREMVEQGADVNTVCTSRVTDMSDLFEGQNQKSTFNQDIGFWDVSSVRNMSGMFRWSEFNQDISAWDVSNVTDMGYMFYESIFNQDLSSWNVVNVIDCREFRLDTPQWVLPKPNFTNCDPN